MRTFTCFTFDDRRAVPVLSVILAETEMRARELARRELEDARRPLCMEVREGGRLLWIEWV